MNTMDNTVAQCLKIPEKVSFNIVTRQFNFKLDKNCLEMPKIEKLK